MKKIITKQVMTLFVFSVLLSSGIRAQIINTYTFSASTGTYAPISGGLLFGGTGTDDELFMDPTAPAGTTLSEVGPGIPVGFSFKYNDMMFDRIGICANGWISLGSSALNPAVDMNSDDSYYEPISTTSLAFPDYLRNRISGFGRDMTGRNTSAVRVETIGTSPNMVCVVQWQNYKRYSSGNTYNGDTISFQIRLYETSNIVELVYGKVSATSTNTATVQVGLAGTTPDDFHNRTTGWASSTKGTTNTNTLNYTSTGNPVSGTTYTFTPPVAALPVAPVTGTSSNITSAQAVITGTVRSGSYPLITASGFVVGLGPNPTVGSALIDSTTNPLVSSGAITKTIAGLYNGTTYYYRTYATNSLGTSYGYDSTFTTNSSASLASISKIRASAVTPIRATVGGNIINDGGAAITASGIVYSTSPNPVLFGTGVVDSTTTPVVTIGSFAIQPSGLTPATKYYYKAYATNSIGTSYSVEDSFTTAPIITAIPYTENFDGATTPWVTQAIGGGANSWQIGTPSKTAISAAYSAPNALVTQLTGNYLNGSDCAVVSPQMDFTSQTVDPVLRFVHKMDLDNDEPYDGGVVEISINGGPWTVLDDAMGAGGNYNTASSTSWYNDDTYYTNYPNIFTGLSSNYSSQVNGWITSTTPLTGAAGQSDVKIRFTFNSDGGVGDGGWAIDNVEVFAPVSPSLVTGGRSNVTTTNATLSGTISSNGNNTITASGIVLGTSPAPIRGGMGVIDSATNPLVSNGAFSVQLGNLIPGLTYYYRAYAENAVGVAYGADSTFTTNSSATAPAILRIAAAAITPKTVTLGGNITNDGGSVVIASGVVYSTSPNPSLFGSGVVDSTTNPVVTSGSFSVNPVGLAHSTKYYYRAYAMNSIGTSYSLEDSFTTAPIISAVPYTENFDGSSTPWVAQAVGGGANSWQIGTPSKTVITAAFSTPNALVTQLSSNYLNNSECAVVSPQLDFTAQTSDPVLRFVHKMDLDNDEPYDGGVVEISINGGPWTVLDNTVGTGTNYNTASSTAWYNDDSYYSNFLNIFTGLSSNYSSQSNGWITSTTPLTGAAGQADVKVRFYFTSDGGSTDGGWAIDNIEIFAPVAPSILTRSASNITTSAVTVGGNITANGNNGVTASGVVLGTSPTPTRGAFGVVDSATNPTAGNGIFSVNITGLTPGTTYYYRAYAQNGAGLAYGGDSTFTTSLSATAPTVIKTAATALASTSVRIGGNITSDGGAQVIASGVVYSTSPNPVLSGMGVIDSTTSPVVMSGLFSVNPAGLSHSTKYYYKAYAMNGIGTTYSSEDSFTTAPIISSLPYNQNFDGAGNTGWGSAIISGTVNDWVLGTPSKFSASSAYSAPNAWVTRLSTGYSSDHNAALVSPQFDLSAITSAPVLRFKHNFDLEDEYDGGWLEMSINGGAWTIVENVLGSGANANTSNAIAWYAYTLATGSFNNAWSGYSGYYSTVDANGWITSMVPLTGANGQSNVKLRFVFSSDSDFEYDGWAIDDIELYVPSAPLVITGTKSNVTTSNATLRGTISNDGGHAVTASGVVFGTSPAPLRGTFGVADSGSTAITGSFSINTTGLFPSTTYYYRAYAVNTLGTGYGADSTFTTPAGAVAPSISSTGAINVTGASAVLRADITSDGGSAVTASGVVYSTSPNPVLSGTGVVDSTTSPVVVSGTFSLPVGGLVHSTKYYYKAYATNAAGTAYSDEDSFTTALYISALPYRQDFEAGSAGWNASALVSSTASNQWVLGTPAKTYISGAHSGTKAWVTKLTGNYDTYAECVLESPHFNFTGITDSIVLRFHQKFLTEPEYDGMAVEISYDGGVNWEQLKSSLGTGNNFNTSESYAWYNDDNVNSTLPAEIFSSIDNGNILPSGLIYASQNNGWIQSATFLTGASGKSDVKLRFSFSSDVSGNLEGFAIDDIEVVRITVPATAASNINVTPSATSANVSLTKGNGERRLVVARLAGTSAVAPGNWNLYNASTTFGSGDSTAAGNYVVYSDTGSTFTVTGLTQITNYAFDVYEYDGKYMHARFGPVSNGSTTTTPVKLISFAGVNQNGDGIISWSTSSEQNNAGFNLERSVDGKTFEFVSFIKGSGNSNSLKRYGYTDAGVFAKTGSSKLFYRLKQLDRDGRSEYSSVISITRENTISFAVTAYPVPFTHDVTLNIQATEGADAIITIVDVQGRIISDRRIELTGGSANILLEELNEVKTGVYFVKVIQNNESKVVRVVKIN